MLNNKDVIVRLIDIIENTMSYNIDNTTITVVNTEEEKYVQIKYLQKGYIIKKVYTKSSHEMTQSENYTLNKLVFNLDKLLTSLILKDDEEIIEIIPLCGLQNLNINKIAGIILPINYIQIDELNNIVINMGLYKDNNDFRET